MEQLCNNILGHEYKCSVSEMPVNMRKHAVWELAIANMKSGLKVERNILKRGLPTSDMINLKANINSQIKNRFVEQS